MELLQTEAGEFHDITAITKPQIESLLTQGLFPLELFDERLAEVTDDDTGVRNRWLNVLNVENADRRRKFEEPFRTNTPCVRYILRRNPQRTEETAANREEKCQTVANGIAAKNTYLAEHPRAAVEVALRHVQQKIDKLRLPAWLSVSSEARTLSLMRDEEAWAEIPKLDGCYCLKTDLTSPAATKEVVHDRDKSLADAEWAFRTCQTSHLEVRPIYVRKESRTRGRVFVVMLAYQTAVGGLSRTRESAPGGPFATDAGRRRHKPAVPVIRELARCWQALDVTVAEGIDELSSLCMTQVTIRNETTINQLPAPRPTVRQLLEAAEIIMPQALPYTGTRVYTKKKLTKERKAR